MKPSEKINRTYDLKRTEIAIPLANGSVRAPATVSLELSPRPQIILSCEFSSADAAATNELRDKGEATVQLDNGMTIETIVGNRWHLGGGKMSNILIPKSEPATVRDDKELLVRCEFELLNFPSMWGKKDVYCYPDPTNTTSSLVYPRFQLEMKPWFIDVFATDSLQGIHYNLMRRGGSAITHTGTITRVDGQKFCLYELDRLLAALHLFLSFARGSYCGLTRLSGYDSDGNLVWEQWGTYQVEPWRRELPTWVDGLSSHTLSPVFMGLWRLLSDPRRSDTISKVIHWYIIPFHIDEAVKCAGRLRVECSIQSQAVSDRTRPGSDSSSPRYASTASIFSSMLPYVLPSTHLRTSWKTRSAGFNSGLYGGWMMVASPTLRTISPR